MIRLNFPQYSFKVKHLSTNSHIFDTVRRKYVMLTPEEWVRQHVVQWLAEEKNVPKGLIAVESSLVLNSMSKRADIVVYENAGKPLLIVECKAPSVKIDQKVFDQVARYNMVHKANYLMVTNGFVSVFASINHQEPSYAFIPELPDYKTMYPGV
jgi:hypothetical protein